MRIPLQSDLITRDGTVDQDAGMFNAFVDGDDMVKRPAVDSVLATSSGAAQGGIANNSKVYMINGDTLKSYTSGYVLSDNITL